MHIRGGTADEIAGSIRTLVDSGALVPGAALPPVRKLAERLGVNRNTVNAAYQQLAGAGVAISRGRAGTTITSPADVGLAAEEGFARDSVLRDIGDGNPDPALLPDIAPAMTRAGGRPVLYGEPTIDPELEGWATGWIEADQPREFRLTTTSGSVDAVERLLAQALSRGDAVALEDPCFLSSISTVRLAGYRTVPVPVDACGVTVDGLREALDAGARAVVCTPRAQNPTGASLTARRASELRRVLAGYPHVMVIEDDHFSLLAQSEYHSVIAPDRARWALVRSVSKSLGPDLRVAVVASDPVTADRLAARISRGTIWVSHLLQRVTHALLADPDTRHVLDRARTHYAERNRAFLRLLGERGLTQSAGDGLNVWVDVHADAAAVVHQLMRRGWLARRGADFALADQRSAQHLRLTVHTLDDAHARALADDLVGAIAAAQS